MIVPFVRIKVYERYKKDAVISLEASVTDCFAYCDSVRALLRSSNMSHIVIEPIVDMNPLDSYAVSELTRRYSIIEQQITFGNEIQE